MSNIMLDMPCNELPPHQLTSTSTYLIRDFGLVEYAVCYLAMQRCIEQASHTSLAYDEFWCVQHPQTYTVGLAGRSEHFPKHAYTGAALIPLIHTDRGGQITYHAPGQAIIYTLVNLRAHSLGVRQWVHILEQAIIDTLACLGIRSERRLKAPGVYVNKHKIASLGLRFRKGWIYHGLALNVAMDLEPFQWINTCGQEGLCVTQLADLGYPNITVQEVSVMILSKLLHYFS